MHISINFYCTFFISFLPSQAMRCVCVCVIIIAKMSFRFFIFNTRNKFVADNSFQFLNEILVRATKIFSRFVSRSLVIKERQQNTDKVYSSIDSIISVGCNSKIIICAECEKNECVSIKSCAKSDKEMATKANKKEQDKMAGEWAFE